MKKNEIFTFTAPNGVEVTAVVIMEWPDNTPLIYAQNRIAFFNCEENHIGGVLVDYAILPEYDAMLEAEQQKFEDDCYEALSSIGDVEF